MGGTRNGRRVTMAEAAEILGVSAEAIRKRVQRGTIPTDKGTDGRRYVYLDTDRDGGYRGSSDDHPRADRTEALIAELQDRVHSLEEANRENRRIIAALTQRIPAIEAPEDASESAESRSSTPTPTDAGGEHEEAAEDQRGWFRRFFGV
jgi:hypothetical protein